MVNLVDRTYYEILGISQDATVDEIKEAYKGIARAYHPDSNFYDEIIQAKSGAPVVEPDQDAFKKVTEAYNTLVNEERRREYDKLFPKGLRDWEQIERGLPKQDFIRAGHDSNDNLKGAIYRPRGNTGTFKRAQFGIVEPSQDSAIDQEMTEKLAATTRSQAIVSKEKRGHSIEPIELPKERNIIGWFVALLAIGFMTGGALAYWVATHPH